jgi:predicted ATP-grasp superfamily ATP-dependent carboligase
MANILVPDYLGQQTLSGIRSLAASGDIVDLANNTHYVLHKIFKSRAVNHYFQIPNVNQDESKYIQQVLKLLSDRKYDIVLPFGLASYYTLSKYKKEVLEHTCAMLPDYDSLKLANDKLASSLRCRELGLDTPALYSDYQDNDIQAISRQVRYPVVVKARSGSGVREGLRYAKNQQELILVYEELMNKDAHGPFNPENPLIQEFIPGYIHDACVLSDNGKPVNILTQIRQIMYPITGGVGAVNVTTNDPELKKLASRILEGINWHGPAQIEFKFDPRDKQYKFIEFNPKLWGTLDLSIQAGMDFPGMIRDLCLGKDVERVDNYQVGLRYIFRYKQFYRAKQELKRIKNWREYYQFYPYHETKTDFDWRDPLPDLFRMLGTIVTKMKYKPTGEKLPLQFVLNGYEDSITT